MKKKVLVAAALAALAAGLALFAYQRNEADRIAAGVSLGGIELGGLDRTEAESRLEADLAPRLSHPLKIAAGGNGLELSAAEIGAELEIEQGVDQALQRSAGPLPSRLWHELSGQEEQIMIEPELSYRKSKLAAALERIAERFEQAPEPGRVIPSATRLRVIAGRPGDLHPQGHPTG